MEIYAVEPEMIIGGDAGKAYCPPTKLSLFLRCSSDGR